MKQTPLPMVSGRYFLPNAPLLCLKWMPACAVTSTNSIGPEGRVTSRFAFEMVSVEGCAVEVGDGAGEGDWVDGGLVSASVVGLCSQPAAKNDKASKSSKLCGGLNPKDPLAKNGLLMPPRVRGRFAGNRTTFR